MLCYHVKVQVRREYVSGNPGETIYEFDLINNTGEYKKKTKKRIWFTVFVDFLPVAAFFLYLFRCAFHFSSVPVSFVISAFSLCATLGSEIDGWIDYYCARKDGYRRYTRILNTPILSFVLLWLFALLYISLRRGDSADLPAVVPNIISFATLIVFFTSCFFRVLFASLSLHTRRDNKEAP